MHKPTPNRRSLRQRATHDLKDNVLRTILKTTCYARSYSLRAEWPAIPAIQIGENCTPGAKPPVMKFSLNSERIRGLGTILAPYISVSFWGSLRYETPKKLTERTMQKSNHLTNSDKLTIFPVVRLNEMVYQIWDIEKCEEVATFYSHATAEAVRCYLIQSRAIDAPWA
jgi:hypothetical protein